MCWSFGVNRHVPVQNLSNGSRKVSLDCIYAWSKHFNIELREVIFGCCITNAYDGDTMSPDVGIKIK